MPLISTAIPKQNFELILERIGHILTDELDYQYTVLQHCPDKMPSVFKERSIAFDRSERVNLNISLARGDYSNKDYRNGVTGTYSFNIDCYATAPSTEDERGDTAAMLTIEDILGKCRYILESPVYKTLGFTPPLIARTYCNSIAVLDVTKREDISNMSVGRLEFHVVVVEGHYLQDAPEIAAALTRVSLSETNKGFQYLFENGNPFSEEFTEQFNR
jgi:hypothetical protein